MKKVIIIGSGFAGLSAAGCLAKEGYDVTILEKNDQVGGRARQFKAEGFTFDMGPSWYWMPDVFEKYFSIFGKKIEDYYDLKRISPSYKVFFQNNEQLDIPSNKEELKKLFEKIESGSSKKLDQFLADAGYKYKVGMQELVYKPGKSIFEFTNLKLLYGLLKMDVFNSISSQIRKLFKNEKLIQLLEFPVLFLGAKPENTPALYSLMNYADMELGTWYPDGGMVKIIDAMYAVAKEHGVKFLTGQPVDRIEIESKKAKGVYVKDMFYPADIIISGADYHHTETKLLPKEFHQYNEAYWKSRTMAPSSLIYYLGINKKLKNLNHHNLFFDTDFGLHASEIYDKPNWPTAPLFYASVPSKTDSKVAPEGSENLFLLIPVAPDMEPTKEIEEKYFKMVMKRLEEQTGQAILQHIVYKRNFTYHDFVKDYNSFQGNAYGLANTLKQTAILKPRIQHKSISNLFFTGQLTVPGPGVPPSIISGQVVANQVSQQFS